VATVIQYSGLSDARDSGDLVASLSCRRDVALAQAVYPEFRLAHIHEAYRSCETIQETIGIHTRLVVAFAVVALSGPLIVFLLRAPQAHVVSSPGKRAGVEDLD
jgi:hypothetical protein